MASKTRTVKDLVEEGKKRIVLLCICVIGLAYLMSLTSSSVWFNIPGAVFVILLVRYISYDLDTRRRIGGQAAPSSVNHLSQNQILLGNAPSPTQPSCIDWRQKVDSPVVETSIDQLTRHLVSEWITNLWYKKVTPDQDAPEEVVNIMNEVLGEICMRAKDVNLIDLLTRDFVNLVCEHIELYRMVQTHIGEGVLTTLSNDERDARLRLTLAADNKLHPALFSAEAEHKVLQRFMDGVMSFTCRKEDLQCKVFRYIARELLSCTVMRPIMNLASPKFINERIESIVLSRKNKDEKHKASESETKQSKSSRSRSSVDHFSGFLDRSIAGVELVQLGSSHKGSFLGEIDGTHRVSSSSVHQESKNFIAQPSQQEVDKANVVTVDKNLSHSKTAEIVETHDTNSRTIQARRPPGGEWAQMLDTISRRKSQALAPEHFENMWTKGRNYKMKEVATGLSKAVSPRLSSEVNDKKDLGRKPVYESPENLDTSKISTSEAHMSFAPQIKQAANDSNKSIDDSDKVKQPFQHLHKHIKEDPFIQHMEIVEESGSSYTSEDDDNSTVTGLGTPGIKVWDSKSTKSGTTSHVRHPLENSDGDQLGHGSKSQLRYRRLYKSATGRKRARSSQGVDSWQELERTTFFLGDGLDILNSAQDEAVKIEDQDESDDQSRVTSGTMASSSSAATAGISGTNSSGRNSQNSHLAATLPYQQLRCKVFGANLVKSGSKTIAVYSISVTDNANRSWSIKRRFRHFEELHRRLKDFPEYSLSLPPKRFLSSSLDTSVVYERCKLLDRYMKDLLVIANVADSIEVWDFLSVDSQTYMFSNSLSIIETLSVDLDDKQYAKHSNFLEDYMKNKKEDLNMSQDKIAVRCIESASNLATSQGTEEPRWQGRDTEQQPSINKKQHEGMRMSYSSSDSDIRQHKDRTHLKISEMNRNAATSEVGVLRVSPATFSVLEDDSSVPSEWTPPNLSVPILNLVDVIFQLQDGGWIRRQAFWVAKQVLQLGMGDAFDDWLIDKIQLLRKGEVIASAIRKIEQILWPDGIFITKHPRRHRPPPTQGDLSISQNKATMQSPNGAEIKQLDGKDTPLLLDKKKEESRRANFVRELMIDNAPAALVGLVGRKEYEHCAQDLYFFLQSAVCVKQLAYGLLELLLLAAFPELHDIVNSCHTEKGSFGVIQGSK